MRAWLKELYFDRGKEKGMREDPGRKCQDSGPDPPSQRRNDSRREELNDNYC